MENTIGKRIRECRIKLGMTQEELAERLYIKKATVSAYENDKFDMKVYETREEHFGNANKTSRANPRQLEILK